MGPPANTQHLSASHRRSVLLDEQQNGVVLSQLGPRCLSLSTTLTVLSMSTPPDHTRGRIRCSGVLCFVKDYSRKAFFIKIYDPEVKRLVWERNLAEVSSYIRVNPLYHLAQLKVGQAGFHFTNESEAAHFAQLVKEKLSIRMQKPNSKDESKNVENESQVNLPTTNSIYPNLSELDLKLTETSFVLVRSALEEATHSLLQNVYTAQEKEENSISENSSTVKVPHRKAPPPPPLINLDDQTDDAKLLSNQQNSSEEESLLDLSTIPDQQLLPPTPPVRTTSKLSKDVFEEKDEVQNQDNIYENAILTTKINEIPPTPPPINFDKTGLGKVFQLATLKKQKETMFSNDTFGVDVDVNVKNTSQLTPIRKAPPVPAPRKCNKKAVNQLNVEESIYQNAMEALTTKTVIK